MLSKFCKENEISFSNNTDITKICNKFNIHTIAMPLDDEKLDGLILIEKKLKVIATNKSLDSKDARFVIAHEFAHFIKESISSPNKELLFAEKDRVFHGGEKKQEEHDMDYLAAAILIPREQFLDEMIAVKINVEQIKEELTEQNVRRTVHPNIVYFFARRYNVKEDVIIRRMAEVSSYA